MKKFLIFNFIFLMLSCSFSFLDELKVVNCVLHIHSNVSGSSYTISDISHLAKEGGVDCILFTEYFIKKVEFGIWPFRNIIKKSVEYPSLYKFGIERYLLNFKNCINDDIILVPGIEITPHYFWSTQENGLMINNLHKHILIVGLDDEKIYCRLPVIHNNYVKKINFFSIIWVVILLLSFILKKKFFLITSLVFLTMSYPYRKYKYDQYSNFGEEPYQAVIDYIDSVYKNHNRTLVIWAHPEATNYENKFLLVKENNLEIFTKTLPYYESLLSTYNYDGFSIFAEGYRKIGFPGGIWDKVLLEYCNKKRKKPIWAFAEVDFGENSDPIYFRKNIVFVNKRDKENILMALKRGNFYSVWRQKDKELLIKNFTIQSVPIVYGEKYKFLDKKLKLSFEISFSDNSSKNVKIYIIKNGEIIQNINKYTPIKVEFYDYKDNKFFYYRIFVESDYPNMLATNPVFIE
ncbi:MAG: hypothetical protein N2643_04630 [Endomicrobia bacterium]|nr:hypothetical protein [Endomicrobiia bacterium]